MTVEAVVLGHMEVVKRCKNKKSPRFVSRILD